MMLLFLLGLFAPSQVLARREMFVPINTFGNPADYVIPAEYPPIVNLVTPEGDFRMDITGTPDEYKIFNYALGMYYGFNMIEAARYFYQCKDTNPMCTWGLSTVHGPYQNNAGRIKEDDMFWGHKYAQESVTLMESIGEANLQEWEVDMIKANAIKFADGDLETQRVGFQAYGDEMARLHDKYDNDFFAIEYCAALMYLQVSDEFSGWVGSLNNKETGEPIGNAAISTPLLEEVIERSNHIQAHHLYIHSVEPTLIDPDATYNVQRGLNSADQLIHQMRDNGIGHLLHMSSHIYIRIGEFEKTLLSTQLSSDLDDAFIAAGRYSYAPAHDKAYGVWAGCYTGQKAVALHWAETLQQLALTIPEQEYFDAPRYEKTWGLELTTKLRFGDYDGVLEGYSNDYTTIERYATSWKCPEAMRLYTQGFAHLQKDNNDQAVSNLAGIEQIKTELDSTAQIQYGEMVDLAIDILSAGIAYKNGDSDTAIQHMENAVAIEAAMSYTQPAKWHMPTTTCLGQIYLDLERYEDAVATFELGNTLATHNENAWGLAGMAEAMRMLPDVYSDEEIAAVEALFEEHWANADVEYTAPCTMFHFETVANEGENCWWEDDDFCGTHGICCRMGYYDLEAGCDGLTGCYTKHCCVDSRLNIHEANTPRSECSEREPTLAVCEAERDPADSVGRLITGCESKCCLIDNMCVPFKTIVSNQYCMVNKITLSDFVPDHSTCAALALHDPLCKSNIFTYSMMHYNCECVVKHDCTFVNDPSGIFLVEAPQVGTLQIEGLEYGVFEVMDMDLKKVTGVYPEAAENDLSRCSGYMLEEDGGRSLCRADPYCRFIDENCYPFEVVLSKQWCYHNKVELASHVDNAVECASLVYHDERCATNVFVYAEKHQRCECLCQECDKPWYTTIPYPGFGVYQITDQFIRQISTVDKDASIRMIAEDTIADQRKHPGHWKEWTATSEDLCGVIIWMAPECNYSEENKKKFWFNARNSICGCSLSGEYTLVQYEEIDSGLTSDTADNTVSYLMKFKHVQNKMAIGTSIYEVTERTVVMD